MPWIPPDIAVITAIGPVHLERMGSEERIAEAKAEILERAPVVVLNVDHPRLAALADQARRSGQEGLAGQRRRPRCVVARRCGRRKHTPTVSSPASMRVAVPVPGVHAAPTNVACAIAVALELGVPAATISIAVGRPADRRASPER